MGGFPQQQHGQLELRNAFYQNITYLCNAICPKNNHQITEGNLYSNVIKWFKCNSINKKRRRNKKKLSIECQQSIDNKLKTFTVLLEKKVYTAHTI